MASNPVFPVVPQNLQIPVIVIVDSPSNPDRDDDGLDKSPPLVSDADMEPIEEGMYASDPLVRFKSIDELDCNEADDRNSTIAFSCLESASAINQNNFVRPHPSCKSTLIASSSSLKI